MAAKDLAGLSLQEQEWLAAYRREVQRLFPGMPEEISEDVAPHSRSQNTRHGKMSMPSSGVCGSH